MTGQMVSPLDLAAAISFTWVRTRASMTAKTSSTDRPEAAIRVCRAAFTWRIAALRSAGGLSQCGSGGNEAAWGVLVAVTARPPQWCGLTGEDPNLRAACPRHRRTHHQPRKRWQLLRV